MPGTLDARPLLEDEELAAVVRGYLVEGDAFLDGVVEHVEVFEEEERVAALLGHLQVREEDVEGGFWLYLVVGALEGADED